MYRQKTPRNFLKDNQELLVGFGLALICLFSSAVFPTQNSVQTITKNLFFLILLPIAYVKIILKKDLADFGCNLKNPITSLAWGAITALFTLFLLYLMLNYTQFKANYTLSDYIKNNFWLFLAYELLIVNFTVFASSFFFQGFLLSVLQKKFKHWAIAVQAILFFTLLFFTKALSWQSASLVLLSVTAGFLAYKTKSFFYSYFMSIFVIIFLDAYIIYLTK